MDDSTTSSDIDLVDFENETVEKDNEQKLMIGTCFDDATSFKNFLRTAAIKSNFTLKIKVSNKRRVVAVCAHVGCPWRVRGALCSDNKTYEVRKLEDTHSCPSVNRTGNKHATVAWVAKEIEALVKKNSEISPKQLKDNLETMYGLSLNALKHVFSNAEHRVCVRHLWKNLKKQLRFDNRTVKSLFWSAANALVTKTYDSKMNELSGINSQIHKYLMALPYTWSRSQYRSCVKTKKQPMWHMYVDEAYHVVRYRMAYEGHISTMPDKEQWSTPADLVHVGIPGTIRPRGRPKKRRITCFLKNEPSRRKSEHRCSRCGYPGHHQNTCKNPLNQGRSEGAQVLPIRRKLPTIGGLAGLGGNEQNLS